MIERIRELSNNEINQLATLGKDALTAISPPVATLLYGPSTPDQLTALQRLGPDTLGSISPQLADMLYGDQPSDATPFHPGYVPPVEHTSDYFKDNRLRWPFQPRPTPGQYNIWSTTGFGCQVCQDNEDAGVVKYGDAFPSGDTAPPAHPGCRCILDPVDNVQSIDDHPDSGDRIYASGYRDRIFELSSSY